jgi:hypothetical protein
MNGHTLTNFLREFLLKGLHIGIYRNTMRQVPYNSKLLQKISIITSSNGIIIPYEKLTIRPTTLNLKNAGDGK